MKSDVQTFNPWLRYNYALDNARRQCSNWGKEFEIWGKED
jgi:hypothetical protein